MSGYTAFKMTASLSDKAEVLQRQEEILCNRDEETLEENDVKASENDEDDELKPIYLIAPKRMGHKNLENKDDVGKFYVEMEVLKIHGQGQEPGTAKPPVLIHPMKKLKPRRMKILVIGMRIPKMMKPTV